MNKSIIIFLLILILKYKCESIVESATGHTYLKTQQNCVLKKLGHLISMEAPIHLLVSSIGVYECFQSDKMMGYVFKMKAFRTIKREDWFGLGFVNYINNLMKKKEKERVATFEKSKELLLANTTPNTRLLINQLEIELTYISKANQLTPKQDIINHKAKEGLLTKDLKTLFGSDNNKQSQLEQYKHNLLNMFIPEDLNLISNAMGRYGDKNEIHAIYRDYEFILEYSFDNTVRVYLNDLRSTKLYRQINCGEYTFKRFLDLLLERYFPSDNFK